MISEAGIGRYLPKTLLTLFTFAALYLAMSLYMVGEPMLAGAFLIMSAMALWIYTSPRTVALRYLFPGIAAALIFVIMPMLYTVSIGFTNYSSSNVLDFERARNFLLDETFRAEGASYRFSLHQDGSAYRLLLVDKTDETQRLTTQPLALLKPAPLKVALEPDTYTSVMLTPAQPLKAVIAKKDQLKQLLLTTPDGRQVRMTTLREFAPVQPLYQLQDEETLVNRLDGSRLIANFETGFFENEAGEKQTPGFRVFSGIEHYKRIFTDEKFREPFIKIFIWTVTFAGLSVIFSAALGLLLAVLMSWEALQFKALYRLLLFLPYAVPGFISILIFKGLFNQNLGEINLILEGLFGIRPQWFADPLLAKVMLLIVNTWLGFPYMMVVCMGLIKAIPSDLYEASAVAGAGPVSNFFNITAPMILKPLTPLLIAAFAFNFNNYVLIALMTGGRPDFLNISVPAGTTDILVSYTARIAFQDSGQQFGLAAAISTVIFLMVGGITLLQMRFTKLADEERS